MTTTEKKNVYIKTYLAKGEKECSHDMTRSEAKEWIKKHPKAVVSVFEDTNGNNDYQEITL